MLWWKHLERINNNILIIEYEKREKDNIYGNQRKQIRERTLFVTGDDKMLSNCDEDDDVKFLQSKLFPICSKGSYLESFLQNGLKTNQLEVNTDSKTFKTFAKLKEPRELFALPKELDCPQQAARWPTECQVVETRIRHITWSPSIPEPYYIKSGKELQPQPVGEEAGTVVFQYYPMSAVNYFSRSTVGGSRLYLSACATTNVDDELIFESRFESGNLAKAIKITSSYYELYLRTDLYTNRHTQWFYFRINNTRKQQTYRFSIVNLSKPESLYNEGMRPLLYSTKDSQLHSIGWRRCGQNITHYKNDPTCEEEEQFPTYTLTFNIEFPHSDDTVYLAHCYPYTYSDLQEYLSRLQAHPVKSTFTKLRLLCRTLAGNNVYYLTITSPNESETKKKRAIVISARVHPGETPSSWMMKGFMDYLTGDSSQAKELREKFIFKLIPMLNPDGVIVGNNRCSLAGKDLNRQYRTVIRETFPSIWHTKVLIRRLQEECGVAMYIDLHAHSRRHNVFIYGCESRRGSEKRLHEQVFPLMLHKNSAEKFSFESCKFRIQRSKEGTGRVVVWMMGVANSYTMEATFAGSELGSRMCTHFSCQDFENMGKTFCETLLDFYDDDLSKEKLRNKIITRLMKEGSNADEPTNIELSDYSSDEGDTSTSSSEAEASQCEPEVILEYPAPPPSPVIQAVLRFDEKPKKRRPKLQKVKTITRYRQTLSVNRGTIDFTSDAVTDCSTENESADNTSPTRGLKKHLQSAVKRKPRRRKRMPPELKVVQAQINLDDTNIKDLCDLHKNRSKSVSVINNVTNWRPFKCFPPPKHLAEIKNFNYSPPLHLLKMSSLKANVWSGTTKDTNEPLSWGVTSSFKLKNYTDSEALLRSCSKKLADLEDEKITAMVRKSKHKNKNPLKQSSNVKEEDSDHCLDNKFKKSWKKKNRKKVSYSEFDNLNDNSKTLGQVMKQLPKDIHGGIRPLKKNSSCVGGIRNKTFAATRGNFSLSNYSEISDSELSSEAASSKKKSIKIKITNNKSIKELKKNVPI